MTHDWHEVSNLLLLMLAHLLICSLQDSNCSDEHKQWEARTPGLFALHARALVASRPGQAFCIHTSVGVVCFCGVGHGCRHGRRHIEHVCWRAGYVTLTRTLRDERDRLRTVHEAHNLLSSKSRPAPLLRPKLQTVALRLLLQNGDEVLPGSIKRTAAWRNGRRGTHHTGRCHAPTCRSSNTPGTRHALAGSLHPT